MIACAQCVRVFLYLYYFLQGLVKLFGMESILLYVAMLLKKRTAVYCDDPEQLLALTRLVGGCRVPPKKLSKRKGEQNKTNTQTNNHNHNSSNQSFVPFWFAGHFRSLCMRGKTGPLCSRTWV
jgi:hypothetical protein